MTSELRRTIKRVFFDSFGPMTAEKLLSLSEPERRDLRKLITQARQEIPLRYIALCIECEHPVFIQAKTFKDQKWGCFVHFKGSPSSCPWYTGKTKSIDDARRDQYGGRQKSPVHEKICHQIADLAGSDPSIASIELGGYLRSSQNYPGRYPDVLITYKDGRRLAIEVQKSGTFQTEVVGRDTFYAREKIPLIWVLYGIDPITDFIPQSFQDVIHMHRGNAFTIDSDVVAHSRAEKKLFLRCYLRSTDEKFSDAGIVSLDQLIYPNNGSPFLEDRISPTIKLIGLDRRDPWVRAFRSVKSIRQYADIQSPAFVEAFDNLCNKYPDLKLCPNGDYESQEAWRRTFIMVVGVLFSLFRHALGRFHNYVTHQNDIKSLLNSKLPSEDLLPFATFFQRVLNLRIYSDLLQSSVKDHLDRALAAGDGNFFLDFETPIVSLEHLFPEIFDTRVRDYLTRLGELPKWAQ